MNNLTKSSMCFLTSTPGDDDLRLLQLIILLQFPFIMYLLQQKGFSENLLLAEAAGCQLPLHGLKDLEQDGLKDLEQALPQSRGKKGGGRLEMFFVDLLILCERRSIVRYIKKTMMRNLLNYSRF